MKPTAFTVATLLALAGGASLGAENGDISQSVTSPVSAESPGGILEVHGLTIVPDVTTAQVITNTDVRLAALPLESPDNLKSLDDEAVTTIVAVKGASAAQLVPILRPLMPQWGHLSALPEKNALLIVDRTANVKRLVAIIKIFEALPKAAQPEQP